MKKLLGVVGIFVVLFVLGVPLATATVLAAVVGPSVQAQLSPQACAAYVPPLPNNVPPPGATSPHSVPTSPTLAASTEPASDSPSSARGNVPLAATFPLPGSGEPRRQSRTTPAAPIPARIAGMYAAAGARFGIPWTLLAGIGMEETRHGAATATSSAGAQGLMQFLPATFAEAGIDGDGDGHVDILSDADSIYSAANYLIASGVKDGPGGVREALFAYNHADWYVNDVLSYAHAYGGGMLTADSACAGDQAVVSSGGSARLLTSERMAAVLAWAAAHTGLPYVFGATGPDAYDCSSFTQAAFRQAGVRLPRTAAAQGGWLAAGHGTRVAPGQEQAGDVIFWNSYLGPDVIGHVVIVWNPATKTTVEAHDRAHGTGWFSYRAAAAHHARYEVWRLYATKGPPVPARSLGWRGGRHS